MSLWVCRKIKVSVTLGLAGLAGCLAVSPAYSVAIDYSGFASVVTGITTGDGNVICASYDFIF